MSEKPSQSDFIREMQQIHHAQQSATTESERTDADDAMALFLQYNAAGRLQEYFARQREIAS